MKSMTLVTALTMAAGTAGCDYQADVGEHAAAPPPMSPLVADKLDLLVVVDNSGSMIEEQEAMSANFQLILDALEGLPGDMPSLHVGVISSDMGAGPQENISQCAPGGDGGHLQFQPRDQFCDPPADPYISDVPLADGARETNYTGTLADAFACIGVLGTGGCGFEQPLAALRRALEDPDGANAGFLRDDAHLAVVFITDEDDCSALDGGLFDTAQHSLDSELGPLSSFRCLEFGVTCDGGTIVREPGTYSSCAPRAESPYVHHPDDFVDYVTTLKGDPDKVIVSVIAGDRGSLEIGWTMDRPDMHPSCASENGEAFAAYRLGYFAEQFSYNRVTSICEPSLTTAIESTANLIGDAMRGDEPPGGESGARGGGCASAAGSSPHLALLLLGALALAARRRRYSSP